MSTWNHVPVGGTDSLTPPTAASATSGAHSAKSAPPPPREPSPVTPITPDSATEPDTATTRTQDSFGPDFDPDLVPPFPVITTEISPSWEQGWDVTVDGVAVGGDRPADEATAADLALTKVSEMIAARGWDACRVEAIAHRSDDEEVTTPLIVGVTPGQIHYLEDDEAEQAAAARRPRQRLLWIGVGAATFALVAAGGVFAGTILAPDAAPPPPAQTIAAPEPVQLPAQPPAGLSSAALWASEPIAGRPAVAPDGTIVAAMAGERTIGFIDPTAGRSKGTLDVGGQLTGGPWLITSGTRTWLVWQTSKALNWAAYGDSAGPHGSQEVPAGTDLIVTDTGLAWETGPTGLMVLGPEGPVKRTIPADSEVVALTSPGTVWVSDQTGRSWKIDTDAATAPEPLQLAGPADAVPTGIVHATDDALLARWKTGETFTYTIHRPDALTEPAAATIPATSRTSSASQRTLSGRDDAPHIDSEWFEASGALVNLTDHRTVPLPASATVDAVIGNTAWLHKGDSAIALDLPTGLNRTEDRPAVPARPVSAVASNSTVIVDAESEAGSSTRQLYALPRN